MREKLQKSNTVVKVTHRIVSLRVGRKLGTSEDDLQNCYVFSLNKYQTRVYVRLN